jgi:Mn2+/Fe2+ NRAMP family transporter
MDHTQQTLQAAKSKGTLFVLLAFLRLSGPGWLQSALTLGGGSLASSMYLGVIGGYELLWVQPLAMTLGIVMLAAISYVTLTIESSPFEGIRRHINPVLAWAWLLGTLFANMVWALPQYSLSYAVITDNLLPGVFPATDSLATKLCISLLLLLVITLVTFQYDSSGVRVYEWILKAMVGAVVACFVAVAIRLGGSGQLPLSEVLAAIVPDPRHLFRPTSGFEALLAQIENAVARDYWYSRIVDIQRERMIAAASAAVGINMTFLMPYSLLARGWNSSHRGFAVFDLATGLLLPFAVATGCVVIAAASQFYTQGVAGLSIAADGTVSIEDPLPAAADSRPNVEKKLAELQTMLSDRSRHTGLEGTTPSYHEVRLASMLLPRDTRELGASLDLLFGNSGMARRVFGLGVLAMAVSTISLLMLISGFAVCEALRVARGGRWFKLGTLIAATGAFWPLVWQGSSRAYLAVFVGTIGYTLLPIALLTFTFMLNSRQLLGQQRPRGAARVAWNVALGCALLVTGSASIWTAWNIKIFGLPIGRIFIVLLSLLLVAGHWHMRRRGPADHDSRPTTTT